MLIGAAPANTPFLVNGRITEPWRAWLNTVTSTGTIVDTLDTDTLRASLNLSDVVNKAAARTNLGLGSASTHDVSDFDAAGAAAAAQAASLPASTVLAATTTAVSHQFLTAYDATSGAFTQAQPAAADVSGLAASATTDTTNATNIATGTLADGRLSSNVPLKNAANTFTTAGNTFTSSAASNRLTVSSTVAGGIAGVAITANAATWFIDNRGSGGTPANKIAIYDPTVTEVVTLASGGNVGIGDTNPSDKLHVNGALNATSYKVGGTAGVSGTITIPKLTTANGSITVVNGIITAFVNPT